MVSSPAPLAVGSALQRCRTGNILCRLEIVNLHLVRRSRIISAQDQFAMELLREGCLVVTVEIAEAECSPWHDPRGELKSFRGHIIDSIYISSGPHLCIDWLFFLSCIDVQHQCWPRWIPPSSV